MSMHFHGNVIFFNGNQVISGSSPRFKCTGSAPGRPPGRFRVELRVGAARLRVRSGSTPGMSSFVTAPGQNSGIRSEVDSGLGSGSAPGGHNGTAPAGFRGRLRDRAPLRGSGRDKKIGEFNSFVSKQGLLKNGESDLISHFDGYWKL
jgi:hypothetical protein